MPPNKKTALAALGLLIAGCTSMPPSMPPTAAPTQPPVACMASCPTLPALPGEQQDATLEPAVLVWVYDVIDAAGACRRQHDACRAGHPGLQHPR